MEWYFEGKDGAIGPVTEQQLRNEVAAGTVNGDTLVWFAGQDDWLPLNSTDQGRQLLTSPQPAPAPAAVPVSGGGASPAPALAPAPAPARRLFCKGCGRPAQPDTRFCTGCGALLDGSSAPAGALAGSPLSVTSHGAVEAGAEHAGFWIRVGAVMLDSVWLLVLMLVALLGVVMLMVAVGIDPEDPTPVFSVVMFIISYVAPMIAIAAFESSSWQGTPAKKFLNLKVTTLDGQRISFPRSLGRTLLEYPIGLTLGLGYIMVAFTERRQALHDMLCSTLVIRTTK